MSLSGAAMRWHPRANQSLIDKLTYNLTELKEMNILEFYPEDFRDDASSLISQILKEETNYCPLAIVDKLGQLYAVETRIKIGIWNKKDCFFVILKDISQEKENLKLFSKVFTHNPLPMTINNVNDGTFTKVNPAFLATTSYTKTDLIGQTSEALDFFVEPTQFLALKDKLINQQKIKDHELLLRCKDGRIVNGLFSIETISSTEELNKRNFLAFIHPDDLATTLETMKQLEAGEKVLHFVNRFLDVNGGQIPIKTVFMQLLATSPDELNMKSRYWNYPIASTDKCLQSPLYL